LNSSVANERPTLLIVDDETQILSALKRSLYREGYEILTVETAAAALRILEEQRIDAILSDHKMPGMSGVQLLERAAAMSPHTHRMLITAAMSPHTHRMLITGWTEEIPPERLQEIGVCALITKPWDDAKFKATLRRVLGGAQASKRKEGDSDIPDPSSDYSLRR
jgi:response regulator RpfG family c-di-GMP phosphodiesterase